MHPRVVVLRDAHLEDDNTNVTILCYHAVDDSWKSTLVVSPTDFAAQCEWLALKRRVVPLREAAGLFESNGRLPGGRTALTFDDGFEGLLEHALPSLERHGLPATIFVVAETLGEDGRTVDWVDDAPTPPPTTLSLDQILEMKARGVSFMSHTYSHHDLTTLDEGDCVNDLKRSRELLEDVLHESVPYLAYPRGRHNAMVRRAASAAGYSQAFSLPEQREPVGPYAIPRAGIYPGNGLPSLRTKTSSRYLSFRMNRIYPLVRGAGRKARSVLRRSDGNA